MGDIPLSLALEQIVSALAPKDGIEASSEPVADPMPRWFRDRLIFSAGLCPDQVSALSGEQAMEIWERYESGGG